MDGDSLSPGQFIERWARPEAIDAGELGKNEEIDRLAQKLILKRLPRRRRRIDPIGKLAGRNSEAHPILRT